MLLSCLMLASLISSVGEGPRNGSSRDWKTSYSLEYSLTSPGRKQPDIELELRGAIEYQARGPELSWRVTIDGYDVRSFARQDLPPERAEFPPLDKPVELKVVRSNGQYQFEHNGTVDSLAYAPSIVCAQSSKVLATLLTAEITTDNKAAPGTAVRFPLSDAIRDLWRNIGVPQFVALPPTADGLWIYEMSHQREGNEFRLAGTVASVGEERLQVLHLMLDENQELVQATIVLGHQLTPSPSNPEPEELVNWLATPANYQHRVRFALRLEAPTPLMTIRTCTQPVP